MSAADATQPTLREVERSRATAERDRRRLEAEVRAAEGEAQALNRRLGATAQARDAAAAAAAALEAEAADLLARENGLFADAEAARTGFERSLVSLSHASRGAQGAIVATVAGRELAARATRSSAAAQLTRARREAAAAERAGLAVSQAQIESSSAALRASLAEQQARQAVLNADKNRASSRIADLARQARSLRELVARAAPSRRRASPASASGATIARPAPTRLLSSPATIVRRFGERRPGGSSQGLTLRARAGAEVLAPAAGKVAWSGPFRSYGIVLILDLDNGYAVVLTGMDTVRATAGQRVRAGQPVAEMAPDATTAPELYVEVRENGRPIDPARWLGGGG